MKRSDFYYDLPKELIAQDPLTDRASSRLMVIDRKQDTISHRHFSDIKEYLKAGDCLVINNTRVIPARLYGRKAGTLTGSLEAPQSRRGLAYPSGAGGGREETGARIEVLLLKRLDENRWETLVRPGKKCRTGTALDFGEGLLRGRVEEVLPDGNRIISFSYEGIFEEILDRLGQMPLPPYITHQLQDKNRYQTVYARFDGSAAAPTAGLHFTKELLEEIKSMGVCIAELTLHVGLGTFRPVKADDILDHKMHSEYYEISEEAARLINRTRAEGGRIISVGTTSTRTLETAAADDGTIVSGSGWTDIFIYPGYSFKAVDALITNFHLPESTLLMLVSAFMGREKALRAYEEAVRERYRFFSFGDAMLIY